MVRTRRQQIDKQSQINDALEDNRSKSNIDLAANVTANEARPVNGVDKPDKPQIPSTNLSGEKIPSNDNEIEEAESMDIDKNEVEILVEKQDGDDDDDRVVKKLRIDDVATLQEDIDPPLQKRKRVPSRKATPAKAKKLPVRKVEPVRRSKRPGIWDVEHLLTNKRSKIIQTESDVLFNPSSWNLFTASEKEELLGLLPGVDTEDLGYDEAGNIIPHDLFRKLRNDAFRTAYRDLQEDLDNGYWEPSFVEKATKAAEARVGVMADTIDSYKNDMYEEYWGQRQKIYHEDAGEATEIGLHELCKQNKFLKGDVFEFRRKFRAGDLVVEKQLILQDISYTDVSDSDNSKMTFALTFTLPLGMTKYAVPAHSTTLDDSVATARSVQIDSLNKLMNTVLNEDGRAKEYHPQKYPDANSWKAFKIYRNHQLIGTPHEIRQKYFKR